MKKFLSITTFILVSNIAALAQVQKIERPIPDVIKKVQSPTSAGLPAGKDLSIRIKTFQLDPANGGNITLTYAVKNNGADAVDLNNVTVQGYIDYPQTIPTSDTRREQCVRQIRPIGYAEFPAPGTSLQNLWSVHW